MPDETQAPEPGGSERIVRGSDITAIVFGSVIFGVVIGCGVLNILAAKGGWNPFHWQGRLWTGVFMIAAPSALAGMAVLPARIRTKLPDALIEWTIVLVWVAFFWAACGGH
jgi:hypothetical protein